jgi:DNA repair ATPase RecN
MCYSVRKCKIKCQKVDEKNCQKVVQKVSQSCQKVVKKLQRIVKKLQKVAKNCKKFQQIDKKLSKKLSKISQFNKQWWVVGVWAGLGK